MLLRRQIERLGARTWDELAEKIGRLGYSEFDPLSTLQRLIGGRLAAGCAGGRNRRAERRKTRARRMCRWQVLTRPPCAPPTENLLSVNWLCVGFGLRGAPPGMRHTGSDPNCASRATTTARRASTQRKPIVMRRCRPGSTAWVRMSCIGVRMDRAGNSIGGLSESGGPNTRRRRRLRIGASASQSPPHRPRGGAPDGCRVDARRVHRRQVERRRRVAGGEVEPGLRTTH